MLLCVCSVCALQADSVRGHSTHLSPWQVSVLLDKSLRPKITEENWWSIRYYSIFALINLRNMVLLWMDKWPIQFNQQVPPFPPPGRSRHHISYCMLTVGGWTMGGRWGGGWAIGAAVLVSIGLANASKLPWIQCCGRCD